MFVRPLGKHFNNYSNVWGSLIKGMAWVWLVRAELQEEDLILCLH